MAWKATGTPTVRKQRGRWVVRIEGFDTETGRRRPKQLGTYDSRRAAQQAALRAGETGPPTPDRRTVAWAVDEWLATRTHVSARTLEQYRWGGRHVKEGLGSIPLSMLERSDIGRWLSDLASEGRLARRSILICRLVLRAALDDAVHMGALRQSPAARVAMPRDVARPGLTREVEAWDSAQVRCFLETSSMHRWAAPLRLAVLYGLRRSELLALKWDDLDVAAKTIRIDEGLVNAGRTLVWTGTKNAHSRRTIPIDATTAERLVRHRREQLEERLLAGPAWMDHDLVVCTKLGKPVFPRNFDQTLRRAVSASGLPKLTSHGLRHTAATQMVRQAADIGDLRAVADVLGHSPDMLMRIYAHALPDSVRAVADRIGLLADGG
jgi:integrase